MRSAAAAWALACLVALSAGTARAYCRTSTCSSCPRDAATGCTIGGTPIAWPNACVSFSMHEAASASIELARATTLMSEAFAVWENARCGKDRAKPSISVSDAFGPALCGTPQYNTRAGNANVVMFRDDHWPYTGVGRELAATSLIVDGQGAILDADIEINATGPLAVPEGLALGVIVDQHDLYSIMVHEAGHFLGLDQSREASRRSVRRRRRAAVAAWGCSDLRAAHPSSLCCGASGSFDAHGGRGGDDPLSPLWHSARGERSCVRSARSCAAARCGISG